MSLRSLLLSSDEKTVRVLRRVLSDLEIDLEHSGIAEEVVRKITRFRFEAIIVDCVDADAAGIVFGAAKSAAVNKRALSIALVDAPVGLKGGFDMGAHFVLHKPLAVERAKSSFRAVRALMKSERRVQMRIPVQVPVDCVGSGRYPAQTLDVCEGGMAIRYTGRQAKEKMLRFSLTLPGTKNLLELWGGTAWEGTEGQVGIRFQDVTEEQRSQLRNWLKRQLPERDAEDPPVSCRLTELSAGGCYLSSNTPFPRSARVILTLPPTGLVKANGIVRIVQAEHGMGIEFLQATVEQRVQTKHLLEALRSLGENAEVQVQPDGLDAAVSEEAAPGHTNDPLLALFRHQPHLPLEEFLQQMKQKVHAHVAH